MSKEISLYNFSVKFVFHLFGDRNDTAAGFPILRGLLPEVYVKFEICKWYVFPILGKF